ncbi:hypothetical protein F7725_010137 [Dissostichus mawsoni]|uniref:Cadherin domain-containing protein n=1 Tax=Dissostichus mawsoni TaxID=36200 RepID=A0A7J5XPB0_DISMA|nr:hypothetical protein F7725_010137 [Dissostichus mawsoni]
MYLLISDNLAEVPELKDISYDEKNSKLTSYLIIALVAIPSAYLPPNYADVDGTGTLRSAYNYDAYLTTGSRTSDFKFVSSYNDNTLPADQTLRKSPSDFAEVFGDCDSSPEPIFCFACFIVALHLVNGDLSYSIQEEMKRQSVIGNVAKDLGLDLRTLSSRKARVDSEGTRKRNCDINLSTGDLVTSERMDRESLCGKKPSCVVKVDLVLENPLELHRVSLHIQDVNENSPQFNENLIEMEIRESAEKANRFSIEEAHDADIGQNAVQRYSLQKNENFILAVDSNKVELVLEDKLDREKRN